MRKVKYIRTSDNSIIVFGEAFNHSDFRHFNPSSAGFIRFKVNKDRTITCECYGGSVSLGLNSVPSDSIRAQAQFNLWPDDDLIDIERD